MKILFIIPSLRLGSKTKILPVGPGYIMTFIDKHGYKFDLLDVDINDYGDDYVENYLANNKYDVILSGCIVTHYKWMKWMCLTAKKYQPDVKIIVGNSVAGSTPEIFLRNSKADFSVIGEGEFTTVELLNALRDGEATDKIQSIAYIDDDGEFVQTEKRKACNINDIPLVDWKLLDYQKYFDRSDCAYAEGVILEEGKLVRVMPVTTARGCTFKCTFCHFVFWDDPYRHRSPENILSEIRRNIEEYGATYINFWDDLSFSSMHSAEKAIDAIIDSGLKFDWDAAIRSDLFGNPKYSYEKRLEVAKKFKKSGCKHVSFSLESGSQEILDMMNKKVKVECFLEQIKVLKEAGIVPTTSIIFGYPNETPETIQLTFDMCFRAQVYPSIGFLLPLPYTEMYEYAKKHGFITNEDGYLDAITERQDFCLNMTSMSDEEIMIKIKEGAMELNKMLELGLTPDRLVKTGGYRKHTKVTAQNEKELEDKEEIDSRPAIDPENMERNENDFSFNYSKALFDEVKTNAVLNSQAKKA